MNDSQKAMRRLPRPRTAMRATAAAVVLLTSQAHAFQIETDNPDLEMSWNNTVKYSTAYRLKDQLPELLTNRNQDDGNLNFNKGQIQSRFDLLSEFDAKYKNFGLRVSAAAWRDSAYLGTNDHPGPTSNRPLSEPRNTFSPAVKKDLGQDAELLDAFVYGQFDLAGKPLTARLGRHSLVWGESLFFAANSIAAGMNPTDVIKARSVPGSTTKEIIRPVGKLSLDAQLTDTLSASAFVPYEWESSKPTWAGSYFSAGENLAPAGELSYRGPTTFTIIEAQKPKSSGQGGVSLRWRSESLDTDFGFHAVRYHVAPSNFAYLNAAQQLQWMAHEGVQAYAVSAAKTIGNVSWGAEASIRRNTPLPSDPATFVTMTPVGPSNPGYAVGNTGHLQVNWIANLGPSWISQEAGFAGEVAWNRLLSVDYGAALAARRSTRDATAIRMVYTPTYRQVIDGLDLSVPLSVGYTMGRSAAVGPAFGPDKGGDVRVGLAGTYLTRWLFTLDYTHFIGKADLNTTPINNVGAPTFTYAQPFKDRNFVSLSVRTTF
ncbi:DUF1302 domain-containing protein (plasmid) [Sphaerotilus natans]|uniref:DUF1302 domain-containing protein n=1 Tax=Sphaerotilus natans TaxID=34103 RepID=UPI00406C9302